MIYVWRYQSRGMKTHWIMIQLLQDDRPSIWEGSKLQFSKATLSKARHFWYKILHMQVQMAGQK